jgi:muramoyltetrapeptide carboxypeptidase
MLDQLRLLHIFDEVAGILIGDFSDCEKEDNDTYSVDDFMEEYFTNMRIPVISNIKCGHCFPTATIPLGTTCFVDTKEQIVKFINM